MRRSKVSPLCLVTLLVGISNSGFCQKSVVSYRNLCSLTSNCNALIAKLQMLEKKIQNRSVAGSTLRIGNPEQLITYWGNSVPIDSEDQTKQKIIDDSSNHFGSMDARSLEEHSKGNPSTELKTMPILPLKFVSRKKKSGTYVRSNVKAYNEHTSEPTNDILGYGRLKSPEIHKQPGKYLPVKRLLVEYVDNVRIDRNKNISEKYFKLLEALDNLVKIRKKKELVKADIPLSGKLRSLLNVQKYMAPSEFTKKGDWENVDMHVWG